jgi:HlyD family secretion protein
MKLQLRLICLLLVLSCRTDPGKIKPTVEDISESVYASGVVKSKNQYDVFSSVSGIITEVLIQEGDSVSRGTPLVKISNKTAILNANNAELAAKYANLLATREKLDELRMVVDLANSKKEIDSLLWTRQQNLSSKNIGTRAELEQRELAYKTSESNYRSAIIRFKELQQQLDLNVNQSYNTFQISNAIANDYMIKSEIGGIVYKVVKKKGEMATNTSPIALIGEDKTFVLELEVDETDIVRIKPGQSIFLRMESYPGEIYEAIVSRIEPSMNERSKSFTVEADFIKAPSKLYPFLSVEANIVIQRKNNALTIPRSYLVEDSFVITGRNQRKRVVTGLKDYQKVEVLSGLRIDEFILPPKE